MTRSQNIDLVEGWNAVWLEVSPANDQVASVFDASKVDVVARYFTPQTPVRFIEDPGEHEWNKATWGVWYAPSRAEAFLSNLHAIQGNCAYLVHATTACSLNITGEVRYRPLRWNTDSYNLVGLPVSGAAHPTFARFFSGAAGRLGAQVYRLAQGSWQKISDLAGTEIRPGEAYWIYADGKTNYQGPLELRFTGGDRINFGANANLAVIELNNKSTAAYNVTAAIEPGGDLPLFQSVQNLSELTGESRPLTGETPIGAVAAGGVSQLRIELRPAMLQGTGGSAVLKISTSEGVTLRLPVRATLP